jgi:dihydrofolate reductase
MIQIDIRINDRLATIRRKDGGKRLTAHLTGLAVSEVPEFPKLTIGVEDAIICAFVRMGTANRSIEGIPVTRLEKSLGDPLMKGCPVVMGMGAYNDFGYKLRGYRLFVCTKDPMAASFQAEGDTSFYRTPQFALEAAVQEAQATRHGPVWVWGGAQVYEACWPYLDHIIALKTRGAFPGTKLFPATPLTEWHPLITTQLRTPLGEATRFTATVSRRKLT